MRSSSLFGRIKGLIFPSAQEVENTMTCLEALEARIAPAIFASVSHGTLKITGDELDNQIVITADANDSTKFTISSPIDTINGSIEDLVVTGVKNISIKSNWGSDKITFDTSVPVTIAGNLSINQGFGDNELFAEKLSIGGNFSLKAYEGPRRDASIDGILTDLEVHGKMKYSVGSGSDLTITTSEGGHSEIGSLSVNSSKYITSYLRLQDATIAGDLNVKGHGNTHLFLGGDHGLSTVGGDLKFSSGGSVFLNGIVEGDAKIEFKRFGAFVSSGIGENTPAEVHGDLSISTIRWSFPTVNIGQNDGDAGLKVDGDLEIATGKLDDVLKIKHLQVAGSSKLSFGNGLNSLDLSSSSFGGDFSVKGGKDQDTLSIDTESVVFAHPPKIDPGLQPMG